MIYSDLVWDLVMRAILIGLAAVICGAGLIEGLKAAWRSFRRGGYR